MEVPKVNILFFDVDGGNDVLLSIYATSFPTLKAGDKVFLSIEHFDDRKKLPLAAYVVVDCYYSFHVYLSADGHAIHSCHLTVKVKREIEHGNG